MSKLTGLDCKWTIRALHGGQIAVELVDSDLNDGVFDNILTVVDDTPGTGSSQLKYPGLEAKAGKNDFGKKDDVWLAGGKTVTVTFKSAKNTGHAQFKLKVSSKMDSKRQRGVCGGRKAKVECPKGPCDCVIEVGTDPYGKICQF